MEKVYGTACAGIETSVTTLSWALLLMARHPDVQRRVRDDIRAHLGDSRRPTMTADRLAMRYTEAGAPPAFTSLVNFSLCCRPAPYGTQYCTARLHTSLTSVPYARL